MSDATHQGPAKSHLFSVDILIESPSNGLALEKLVRLLNSPEIKDYKILRGIELGKMIEAALQQEAQTTLKTAKATPKQETAAAAPAAKTSSADGVSAMVAQIERYKANNTLVRITVVKAKGIKLSVPCRILNYDSADQLVSVYHVDEKKVYLFKLNEIDDLQG